MMLDEMAFRFGIAKSLNGLVAGSIMASRVCLPCLLWFLKRHRQARKVASISRLKGAKSLEPWLLLCMQQQALPKEVSQLKKE